jgi:ketosteroid isomerase-like protein
MLSILVGSSLAISAQEPVKPPVSPRIITATRQVAIFTSLETQLLQAIQGKDQAALARLISQDCLVEMPDADPLAVEDWISSVVAKDYSLKSFMIRQLSVIDQGDSALVKFDRVQQSSSKGTSDGGEFFVIDLWKKDGDAWKLSNRYVSKVSSVPWMPKGDVRPTGKK